MIWACVHQSSSRLKLRMQSKPERNSPTPEIGLKDFATQQSGAISSKTTLKDSTPLILVFTHVACASLLLGMRRHLQQTWGGEIDPDVGRLRWRDWSRCWKMVPPNEMPRQPLASPRAWCPGPETGTWQLVATSGVPANWRLRYTTARQDHYIRQMAVHRRHSAAQALQMDFLQASGQRISDQTVSNRLHENGLHSRRPARGPILTREHHRARRDFAQDHQHWQMRHWRPILFTYESRFHVSTCDRRVRVWKWAGEWYADSNIVKYDRYGGVSMVVWDGICPDGQTNLVVIDGGALTAVRYRDEVLEPVIRPFAGALGQVVVLMHDNARPHTARVVQANLEQEGIDVMEWPARSQDLNPLEHIWDILQRCAIIFNSPDRTNISKYS